MNEFDYKITKDVYDWIINGEKNIEVRLYNDKSSKIKTSDIINFKVLYDENKIIRVVVKDLFIYKDLKTLLQFVPINNIAPLDEETLEKLLNEIFGEEDVKSHNIIGIKFEVINTKKEDILIDIKIDKEPYIKELTKDKVINLTGQSGSGKSFYAQQHFNNDDYLIIDTDEIFSSHRFINSKGINKELGEMFRSKYEQLPSLGENFDLIYKDILEYCKDISKTIVIDCATFHCIKDINLLKGKIIVLRTSIDTCYKRCIDRYKTNYPDATKEELEEYMERKKKIYIWVNFSNEFLTRIDNI